MEKPIGLLLETLMTLTLTLTMALLSGPEIDSIQKQMRPHSKCLKRSQYNEDAPSVFLGLINTSNNSRFPQS